MLLGQRPSFASPKAQPVSVARRVSLSALVGEFELETIALRISLVKDSCALKRLDMERHSTPHTQTVGRNTVLRGRGLESVFVILIVCLCGLCATADAGHRTPEGKTMTRMAQ